MYVSLLDRNLFNFVCRTRTTAYSSAVARSRTNGLTYGPRPRAGDGVRDGVVPTAPTHWHSSQRKKLLLAGSTVPYCLPVAGVNNQRRK
jgi:hypothetical protein